MQATPTKPIMMVDTITQYEAVKAEMDQVILDIIQSGRYIGGPHVQGFADELAAYLGAKHVITCANGTDALQVAFMALGLKPGDEVIVPTFTYVATAEVIQLLRLTPVLVDVDPKTFNIDVDAARAAITPKTKAIVPVHLFGQSANMAPLMEMAKEHNLYVVEDTAQAIGADYIWPDGKQQKAGTIGHIGCTSFYPSKNLGCMGDGGAIFTNDDELAHALRQICNHGQGELYKFERVGVNSRLDAIQAGLLRIKLRELDNYNARRRAAANYYDQAFAGREDVITPYRASHSTHCFHQYTLQLKGHDREALRKHLQEAGVPSMIYYPIPLHEQPAYQDARYQKGAFPVSEQLCQEVVSLPMHSELSDAQLQHITAAVHQFLTS